MARIFITGSTDGLGRAAALALKAEGHEIVLHARSLERATAVADIVEQALGLVTGDLASAVETREIADQVNRIGPMDAVIHNAGIYLESQRGNTPEGHATTLAVNTLAPYLLTALIERPKRMIYLSSGMHRAGTASLPDIDWVTRPWHASQAYSESKLHVATLAQAVASHWPDVLSHSVDPGWVPTRMGGPSAPDDLEMGYLTQTWLATSTESAAMSTGHYWHHRRRQQPAAEVVDRSFQDGLIDRLAELTGVALF